MSYFLQLETTRRTAKNRVNLSMRGDILIIKEGQQANRMSAPIYYLVVPDKDDVSASWRSLTNISMSSGSN